MRYKEVSAQTMHVGKKGGGKHWTRSQVAARETAAESMKRKDGKELVPPDWLSKEAREIWHKKLEEAAGVELLDVLDGESLAVYCDAMVKYRKLSGKSKFSLDDHKAMQAYMRIIAQFADKLGFTPAARARLIKRRGDEKEDPFGKAFDS